MKIVDIGAVLLQPTPWVLVKVRTDEGITGIGEAYHGAGVHHIAVDERLTRVALIGQDPRNVDRLFRDMKSSMSASGYYQGAVMSAISGIEMALWDITGQALGVPIWQLLGGPGATRSASTTTATPATRRIPVPGRPRRRRWRRAASTPSSSTSIRAPTGATATTAP